MGSSGIGGWIGYLVGPGTSSGRAGSGPGSVGRGFSGSSGRGGVGHVDIDRAPGEGWPSVVLTIASSRLHAMWSDIARPPKPIPVEPRTSSCSWNSAHLCASLRVHVLPTRKRARSWWPERTRPLLSGSPASTERAASPLTETRVVDALPPESFSRGPENPLWFQRARQDSNLRPTAPEAVALSS